MRLNTVGFCYVICTLLSGPRAFAAEAVSNADPDMDLERLTTLALDLAQVPYDAGARVVPEFLNALGYDQYRDLQYRLDQTLWHELGLPFELSFFHAGYLYRKSVAMNVIDADGNAEALPFSTDLFDYGPQADLIGQMPDDLDFSGFKIWYRGEDEALRRIGLFQGASYLRAVSSFNEYGLSARALAINTTTAAPEEFPDFTAFWFQQPAVGDTEFVFLALAEGPSVVGAYRFVLHPGPPVRLQVEGRLVLRQAVEELGVAPFSSMFWYGENSAGRPADFRPEVHDSDGLFITTGDETVWRPLSNPPRTRTDILPGDDLQAFGLVQRDRNFEHYQDIEARYHLRPDAWVIPGVGMSKGTLRLLEVETPHEYADNVALVWVPEDIPAPGELFNYHYELYFGERPTPSMAAVVATRYGESLRGDGSIEFVVDFDGGPLDDLGASAEPHIESHIDGGELIWQNIRKNPYNDTWRLNLRVVPHDTADGVRLRAHLQQAGTRLSNTWQYWWQ